MPAPPQVGGGLGCQPGQELGRQHALGAPVADDRGDHDPVIPGEQLPQPLSGARLTPEVELAPGVLG